MSRVRCFKNFITLYSQTMIYYILFCDEDSGNDTFFDGKKDILSVDLNNVNFDDVNLYEGDLQIIIHIRLMASRNRLEQREAFKNI